MKCARMTFAVTMLSLLALAVCEPPIEVPTAKKRRFNGEKVFEIAKCMGSDPSVLWAQESEPVIEPHPWQAPPPGA